MTDSTLVGQPLYDMDGNELGTVKDVRGGYLQVNTRLRPDYWLNEQVVQFSGGRGVVSGDAEHLAHPPFGERETAAHPPGHAAAE
jgi:hypothetical protein